MSWSEYWNKILGLLNEDDGNQEFNNPESLEKLKPIFKNKWKKGVDVDSAYFDVFSLI
jgi:hypothetical protein